VPRLVRGSCGQRGGPAVSARLRREDLDSAETGRREAESQDDWHLDRRSRNGRRSGDAAVGCLRPRDGRAGTPGPARGVVVLFCIGCLGILTLGQRVSRLPLAGRSSRLHAVYRRVADSTRFSRPMLVACLLLLGCWISRALGSTFLLSALGVRFSPTLALVVLCVSAAAAILPITAGGAVAGMGTTAGVLFALGLSKGVALNFSLASGLLLTSAALAAAALGLSGSLLHTLRARQALLRRGSRKPPRVRPAQREWPPPRSP
jgi:hypothetical protein